MFNQIEKLQKKSEDTRRKISFLVSVFLTIVIFMIWLSVFSSDFKGANSAVLNENGEQNKKEEITPFKSLKDSFSKMSEDVGKRFGDIKNGINESIKK